MNSLMKRPRVGTKTMIMYAAAAIAGVALGTYQYFAPLSGGSIDGATLRTSKAIGPAPSRSMDVPVLPADRQSQNGAGPKSMSNGSGEGNSLIFANEGLVLRPVTDGDRFGGFLVVRNDSDQRFEVGDVIVSVNDQPVEHSAAGSELLIAALANPDAPVEIRTGEIK